MILGLNRLALNVLKNGDKMTVDQMAKLMQNWQPTPLRYCHGQFGDSHESRYI